MPPADHVLLTRFNLPEIVAGGLVRADDAELRSRAARFEAVCLPSVNAQTSDAFSWLVYFDLASPAWLRARIDGWSAGSAMLAVFREEVSTADLLVDLDAVVPHRHADLVTTNLDGDDRLAADFVARLRGRAAPPGRHSLCTVREPWLGARTCWAPRAPRRGARPRPG